MVGLGLRPSRDDCARLAAKALQLSLGATDEVALEAQHCRTFVRQNVASMIRTVI